MKNYFISNLKYLRQEKYRWSQEKLAEKINDLVKTEEDKIHYTTIGRYENENREPTMGNVLYIAEVFNVPIDDLMCKDLRTQDKNNEQLEKQLLKKVLIEKGYMEENQDMTDEQFDVVLKIYKDLSYKEQKNTSQE